MTNEWKAYATRIGLCVAMLLPVGLAMSLGARGQDHDDALLFEDVFLVKLSEPKPSVVGLSAREIDDLRVAYKTLTEFLRRFDRSYGKPPLELLSKETRGRYTNRSEFYQRHFKGESLISYRVFWFFVDNPRGLVKFRFVLRETNLGVDCEFQQQVVLKRTKASEWRVHEFGGR